MNIAESKPSLLSIKFPYTSSLLDSILTSVLSAKQGNNILKPRVSVLLLQIVLLTILNDHGG